MQDESLYGQNKIQLTNNEVDDGFPSFSPDGQKIVFVSHRANNYDIFIMNQNGTELQQLTHTVSGDYQPSFSPDGLQIVYVSNRNNDYELFIMDSDGQNQRPLTNSVGVNLEPKFSPSALSMSCCLFCCSITNGHHPLLGSFFSDLAKSAITCLFICLALANCD